MYINIPLTCFISLFIWSSYEDGRNGELSIINILCLSLYTIYCHFFLFCCIFILYFVHNYYFSHIVGFGDIWYIFLIHRYLSFRFIHYCYVVILLSILLMFLLNKNVLPFLPILLFIFLIFLFLY